MKENRSGSAGLKKDVGKKHSKQRGASSHALHSREDSSTPRKPRKEGEVTHPHHERELRTETMERIWDEVRKRMAVPTQQRKPSGNWRREYQENA